MCSLITQPFQIGANRGFEFGRLRKLTMQFGDEARHLFLEGVAVVLDFLGADVAAGGEDVAVRGDFGGGGGFAEARRIGILTQRRKDAKALRAEDSLPFLAALWLCVRPSALHAW